MTNRDRLNVLETIVERISEQDGMRLDKHSKAIEALERTVAELQRQAGFELDNGDQEYVCGRGVGLPEDPPAVLKEVSDGPVRDAVGCDRLGVDSGVENNASTRVKEENDGVGIRNAVEHVQETCGDDMRAAARPILAGGASAAPGPAGAGGYQERTGPPPVTDTERLDAADRLLKMRRELEQADKQLRYAQDERDRARVDSADEREMRECQEKLLDEARNEVARLQEEMQRVIDRRNAAEEGLAMSDGCLEEIKEWLAKIDAEVGMESDPAHVPPIMYGEWAANLVKHCTRRAEQAENERDRIDRLCSQLYTDYREQDEWVSKVPCHNRWVGGPYHPHPDCGECVTCKARARHAGRPVPERTLGDNGGLTRAEIAEAEVKRLREALERIPGRTQIEAWSIAEKALSDSGGE